MGKVRVTKDELENFERFLGNIDVEAAEYMAAGSRAGFPLDYSLSSLEQLEAFICHELDGGADPDVFLGKAACYLGEIFRRNVGGEWEFCLKDPKYLYFKRPVISGYSDCPIEFCPIEIIKNFVYSRRKGLFRTAVESDLELKK